MSLDTVANVICASVTSFSPFAVVEWANQAPIAAAGDDVMVGATGTGGAVVTLDGSSSSDPDGDALTYVWRWAGGQATGSTVTIALPIGVHSVTLIADDGHSGTATDTVTVSIDGGIEGSLGGNGRIFTATGTYAVAFRVSERPIGHEAGELRVLLFAPGPGGGNSWDEFKSLLVTSLTLWDDPTYPAGPTPKRAKADSAAWRGTGTWNGVPGYTFEALATDRGEPGLGLDAVAITIRDPMGATVATVEGVLTAGRISE